MSARAEWKLESFNFGGRVNGKSVTLAVHRGAKDRLIPLDAVQKYLGSNVHRIGGDEEIKVAVETVYGLNHMVLMSLKGAEAIRARMRSAPSKSLITTFIEHARRKGVEESIANLGEVKIQEESVKDKTDRKIIETVDFVFPIGDHDIKARGFTREDGRQCVIAIDACRAIGLKSASMALPRISSGEKGSVLVQTKGGPQVLSYMTMVGVHELCSTGRTERAVAIRKFLAREMGVASEQPVAEILDVTPVDTLPIAATPTADAPVEMPKWDGKGSPFDAIREFDQYGQEYWTARRLMPGLEYTDWKNFHKVIRQAMVSCRNSGMRAEDHFSEVGKMVSLGSGATREVVDYRLTRHACHLIAQEGDSDKEAIAAAKLYFSARTMQAEEQDRKEGGSQNRKQKKLGLKALVNQKLRKLRGEVADEIVEVWAEIDKTKDEVIVQAKETAKEVVEQKISTVQASVVSLEGHTDNLTGTVQEMGFEQQAQKETLAELKDEIKKLKEQPARTGPIPFVGQPTTIHEFSIDENLNPVKDYGGKLTEDLTNDFLDRLNAGEIVGRLGTRRVDYWCHKKMKYIKVDARTFPRDFLAAERKRIADFWEAARARASERKMDDQLQNRQQNLFDRA